MKAPDLTRRSHEPEMMDDPELAPDALSRALRAIGRLNALSGTHVVLARRLLRFARERGETRLSVLDVGSGGGDVAIGLARRAARGGVALDVEGCDLSGTAVAHARGRARERGAEVRFTVRDALAELPRGFDAVVCSLLLHHLSSAEVVGFLRGVVRSGARLLVATDLARGRLGHALARAAPPLLTGSRVVRFDAVRSVERAFTPAELRALVAEAGLVGAQVRPIPPCRLIVDWERRP